MYIIKDKTPIRVEYEEWLKWKSDLMLGDMMVRVARDFLYIHPADPDKNIFVSTVFLEIDHQHNHSGPPILFETMVFGGPLAGHGERYSTWEESEEGHVMWVQKVRDAIQAEKALFY